MLHVPFTGVPQAIQAMLAGQVDVMMLGAGNAEAMSRDGNIRTLASVAPERLEIMPSVPTLREQGFDLRMGLWQALYVPTRTPEPIIAQLNGAAHRAMASASFIDIMRTRAASPSRRRPRRWPPCSARSEPPMRPWSRG